jgi:hypothetical protein
MELQSWDSQAPTPQQDNNSKDSNRSTNTSYKLPKLSLNNYTTIICFLAEFGVLICKQHCTVVVNLDVHLRDQHATPAVLRKQIIEQLCNFTTTNPRAVKLLEQPAQPIQELGMPYNGFKCTTCEFITVSSDAIRCSEVLCAFKEVFARCSMLCIVCVRCCSRTPFRLPFITTLPRVRAPFSTSLRCSTTTQTRQSIA